MIKRRVLEKKNNRARNSCYLVKSAVNYSKILISHKRLFKHTDMTNCLAHHEQEQWSPNTKRFGGRRKKVQTKGVKGVDAVPIVKTGILLRQKGTQLIFCIAKGPQTKKKKI